MKNDKGAYPGRKNVSRYAPSYGFMFTEKQQGHTWDGKPPPGMPFCRFHYVPKKQQGHTRDGKPSPGMPFFQFNYLPKSYRAHYLLSTSPPS